MLINGSLNAAVLKELASSTTRFISSDCVRSNAQLRPLCGLSEFTDHTTDVHADRTNQWDVKAMAPVPDQGSAITMYG